MLSTILLITFATLLIGIFVTIFAISIFGYRTITKKKKFTTDECFRRVEKQKLYSQGKFDKLFKREIVIENKDGLKLHGCYIEQDPNSDKVMILLHGYTRAFPMSMQFWDIYLKQGFNLLAIDQRAHGKSEGTYTSYGYYEKHDIDCWVQWVVSNEGPHALIGMHGISLGAGTSLEYLHINKYVKFVVADSPFSNLQELIRYQIKNIYKAPVFIFYHTIHFFVRLFARFRFDDVCPIEAVAKSEVPILFIHGSRDRFIPSYMSQKLYDAKQKGIKRLWIAEGTGHTKAYLSNRQQYNQQVNTFLDKVHQLYSYAVAI
ncbi:MAG: alpha/beta hydrolase [Balneolaceae bacterium]